MKSGAATAHGLHVLEQVITTKRREKGRVEEWQDEVQQSQAFNLGKARQPICETTSAYISHPNSEKPNHSPVAALFSSLPSAKAL